MTPSNVVLALGALAALAQPASAGCPAKSKGKLQPIVEDWIAHNQPGAAVGMCVVALNSAHDEGFACKGKVDQLGSTFTKDTLFEIASLTKTITATLLAKRIVEGEVALGERIDSLLPSVFRVGSANKITFQELATHHSGLPEVPPHNLGIGVAFEDFGACVLTPGCLLEGINHGYLYSNWAFDILGYTLAKIDNLDYMDDIFDSVLLGLDMADTKTYEAWLDEDPLFFFDHVATKYGNDGSVAGIDPWAECPTGDPAGCLYSTPHDMRIWLQYAMGLKTPAGSYKDARHILRKSYDTGNHEGINQGLAWVFNPDSSAGSWLEPCDKLPTPYPVIQSGQYTFQLNYTRVGKDGEAGGSRAWIEFLQDPGHPDDVAPLGIVIMTNSEMLGGHNIDSMGEDLLSRLPLP